MHNNNNNNRLKYQQSKDYLALLLSTSTNVINLQREIQLLLDKQQVTSYQGLVPSEWVVWICVFVCGKLNCVCAVASAICDIHATFKA